MNGTAARRSAATSKLVDAPPWERFAEGALPVPTPPRGRGRRLDRGWTGEIAGAATDAALVCLAGEAVVWLRFGFGLPFATPRRLAELVAGPAYAGFFLLYAAVVVLGCANQNLYRTPQESSVSDECLMVARAVGLATALLVLFIFMTGNKDVSRLVVVSAGVLNVLTLSGWRMCKRRLLERRAAEGIGVSRVLIVGAGRMGQAVAKRLDDQRHLGYQVCGFLDSAASAHPQVLGTVGDLRKVVLTHFVDELFLTLPSDREFVNEIALEARALRVGLKLLPDFCDGLGWAAPLRTIGGFPVMDLRWQPIPALGLAVKRAADVVLASAALILSAPLLLLLCALIRLDSAGPAMYVAERVGRKGRRFRCYKLRTMVEDADLRKNELRVRNEREGPFFKLDGDPRVTRLGRFLRKSSLDELPQLWNVLRGQMSLVGPRPHPIDDYERYSIEHLRRLDVSPGLTGLWQVTARNNPSFETNMALDLEYIENWSLGLDLKILLKTLPAVLRAEGR